MEKRNRVLMISFLILTLSLSAQEKPNLLVNKTFTTKVGSICEETPDDNPCAGQEIYLVLKFEKEEVFVSEKYISSCGKESIIIIGQYKWELLKCNKIKIDADPKKILYTYMEDLIIEFKDEQLLGKRKNGNIINEYIFDAVKPNKNNKGLKNK